MLKLFFTFKRKEKEEFIVNQKNMNALIFAAVSGVGGFFVFLASFLPYLTAKIMGKSGSVNLIGDCGDDPIIIHGVFFLLLGLVVIAGAVVLVLMALEVVQLPIPKNIVKFVGIGVSALVALLMIIQVIKTFSWMGDLGEMEKFIHYSIGFFLLILGSLASVAGFVLSLVLDKE